MYMRYACKCLASFVFLMVLMGGTLSGDAARALGFGCWVLSSEEEAERIDCRRGSCVEWEVNGVKIGTECCEIRGVCDTCGAGPRLDQMRLTVPFGPTFKYDESLVHSSPSIPAAVDGMIFPSGDLGGFDGVPLHFMMCRSERREAILHASTTREGLSLQLGECMLSESSVVVREVPDQAINGIVFHAEGDWIGASYFLASGQSMTLTKTWWDKRLASLRGFGPGTLVTLFENDDFSGSTLTLTTDVAWPDLGIFGWADRVSALYVWPTPVAFHKPPTKGE